MSGASPGRLRAAPAGRAVLLTAALLGGLAADPPAVPGQAPEPEAGAASLYRRTPMVGGDPFAAMLAGRPSLALRARAAGGNSALDLNELGAILFLAERDSLRPGGALDALGLVPSGQGLTGYGDGDVGLRVTAPVGRQWSVGLSAEAAGYGSFRVDDDAVALLRDGNAARSDFAVGESRGDGLVTAEAGLHGVYRPHVRGPGGARLALGAGVRFVRPLYYARFLSVLEGRSRVVVSGDSVLARVALATDRMPSPGGAGAGWLADLMARMEWPDRGAAVEVSVRDLGRVTAEGLVRRREDVDLSTTRLDTVVDVVESLSFPVRDTLSASASPPALVGLTASVWKGVPVQLDGRLLVPVGGDFDRPPPVGEVVSTWRLGPVPLRAGVRVGGRSGVGGRLGLGWETRSFFARASVVTSGGVAGGARGLAASVEAGVWF